ncbi:MAG: hypothetical protein EOP46_05095 [Sphingobacteriaceae bacterium]|nr:MAG: hypothetical protein EOP46_05095 [Sphingobacteriaceae bacterium]
MPDGMQYLNFMTDKFSTAAKLRQKVSAYFNSLKVIAEDQADKSSKTKNDIIPATLSGLMLYLDFNSRQEYDEYEATGQFRDVLKRARLRIEAEYEKKLHSQSSTGAIFALKNLGWNERLSAKEQSDIAPLLHIEIINTGHTPASAENEVDININDKNC